MYFLIQEYISLFSVCNFVKYLCHFLDYLFRSIVSSSQTSPISVLLNLLFLCFSVLLLRKGFRKWFLVEQREILSFLCSRSWNEKSTYGNDLLLSIIKRTEYVRHDLFRIDKGTRKRTVAGVTEFPLSRHFVRRAESDWSVSIIVRFVILQDGKETT